MRRGRARGKKKKVAADLSWPADISLYRIIVPESE